jgi:hypothetical protein
VTVPVYSTCFLTALNTVGALTYAVPAGYRAKLHNMTLWIQDDHPVTFGSSLTVALDDPAIFVWDVWGPTAKHGIYQWTGGEVFSSHLYIVANPLAYSFRANGVLLTLP